MAEPGARAEPGSVALPTEGDICPSPQRSGVASGQPHAGESRKLRQVPAGNMGRRLPRLYGGIS